MAGRLEQMKDEIQKKDFEVKRLHSELNKTAASLMKAEMEVYKINFIVANYLGVFQD